LVKAIQISRTGGPEVLELTQLPLPVPAPGQVRLKVEAVGLNYADILTVAGEYLTPTRLPLVPGMEFAGRVDALGEGVEGVQVGQLVAALAGQGGFAEYAVVPARALIPVPAKLSALQAAAFPVSYYTAYFALVTQARAQPGEWVLVQAAAGALGTALVQVARALGLRVVATASSEAKLELARALGAEVTLLSNRPDLTEAVQEATGGHGVDVLVEVVGGAGFAQSLRMLAYRGRLLVVGSASRELAQMHPVSLMKRNQSLIGVWLTPFLADPQAVEEATAFLSPLLASGAVRPVVGKVFALEQAAEAFAYVSGRHSSGKVVLTP
jgi:NADPH2:quinone reductase